jgi:predicted ester cyclase
MDLVARSDAFIEAYNCKDFAAMEAMMAPNLDFAHFNRDFALASCAELLAILRQFATDLIPDRHFEPAKRVIEGDGYVIREAFYTGTPLVELTGFGPVGKVFRLKFCSVMRWNEDGILVEWKDYG